MGGGLIQLIAVGIQDIYLIGNPQITFFKTVYKKYTNFSLESIQQPIDGRPDFGQQIEVKIERKGDLIKDIIFEFFLPILPVGYYWTSGIGNVLIKQVDLEIGGQLIDRHYSEWLDIWSQLTVNESKIGAYNAMVGNNYSQSSSIQLNSQQQLHLQVPMFFWFNRDYGMALPLIALQFHDVVLKVQLRDINSCYRNDTTTVQLENYRIQQTRVWVDFIYLDMDERRKFAQNQHEFIIDQVQYAGDEYIGSTQESVTKILNFNHPMKEIYWVHVRNDYLQANIKTGNQQLNYALSTLYGSPETFGEGVIQFNGVDRFTKRTADYFRLVQNYQYHTRYSSKNIYTYSFSLNPEKEQPMGSCNMSKFSSIVLYLDYTSINHSQNDMILKTYGVNYNILRIMSGMAGLAFSN